MWSYFGTLSGTSPKNHAHQTQTLLHCVHESIPMIMCYVRRENGKCFHWGCTASLKGWDPANAGLTESVFRLASTLGVASSQCAARIAQWSSQLRARSSQSAFEILQIAARRSGPRSLQLKARTWQLEAQRPHRLARSSQQAAWCSQLAACSWQPEDRSLPKLCLRLYLRWLLSEGLDGGWFCACLQH
jgi:hypothetical protein